MAPTNASTNINKERKGNHNQGPPRLLGQSCSTVISFWIILVIMTIMIIPTSYFNKTEQLKRPILDSMVTNTKKDNDNTENTENSGTLYLQSAPPSSSLQQDPSTTLTSTSSIESGPDSLFRVLDMPYNQYDDDIYSNDKDGADELTVKADPHLTRGSLNDKNVVLEPNASYKKVLVTGGAGFIGCHVAKALLDRGDDVIIVDEMNDYYDVKLKYDNIHMLQEQYDDDRLKVYYGDICNHTLMHHIFEIEQPKWICHMAARAGVRSSISDPYVYIHSNIEGTTRLLDLTVQFGGIVNFVMASSSSVYGKSNKELFSEFNHVDEPLSPYAATKKACELLAYTYHHLYSLNITALRFFTVYGPRGRPDMAPYKFIDSISKGIAIQQYGDGSSIRDYTFIEDIVNGVVRALDRPYPFNIFNLGNNNGTSLKDFISSIESYTGRKAIIDIVDDQPGDVPYTLADIRKAQKYLGYHPQVSIEDGIERTVRWYESTVAVSGEE
jgi:UDP-glucuronate 4-epimerase